MILNFYIYLKSEFNKLHVNIKIFKLTMVAHTYNSGIQEAEEGRLCIWGQTGHIKKTCLKKY
jgi:hypothetical protein